MEKNYIDKPESPYSVHYRSERFFKEPTDFKCHKHLEIYILHTGSASTLIEDEIYSLESDSLVVIKPFELHKTNTDTGNKIIRSNLYINMDFLLEKLGASDIVQLVNPFCSSDFASIGKVYLAHEVIEEIDHLFKTMAEEIKNPDSSLYICLCICKILYLIRRQLTKKEIPSAYLVESNPIRQVIHYINQNLHGNLNVNNIRKELNYSKYYLCHIFKKYMNCTITEYIQNRKISLAKKYLAGMDESITNISNMLGYSSQTYFSTVFKNITGMTPNDYKKHISNR